MDLKLHFDRGIILELQSVIPRRCIFSFPELVKLFLKGRSTCEFEQEPAKREKQYLYFSFDMPEGLTSAKKNYYKILCHGTELAMKKYPFWHVSPTITKRSFNRRDGKFQCSLILTRYDAPSSFKE